MGRLIDADKLKETMSAKKDEYGNVAESFFNMGGELSTEWWCVEDMVDDAPTEEAIPYQWIVDYLTWLKDIGGYGLSDARAVKSMLIKWKMEHTDGCGPDSCKIGG